MGKAKDWTGQKFGKLTFIKATDERNKDGKIIWKLQCECSVFTFSIPNMVARGRKASCGDWKCQTKDWTGQKFGRLTFIRKMNTRNDRGRKVWKLQCDCASIIYREAGAIINGSTQSCGCLFNEAQATRARKYDPIISSAIKVFDNYKNKDCNIDFDTFLKITQQNCDYCGRPPHRKTNIGNGKTKPVSQNQKLNGNFIYNGLDRIDSSKGHTANNVVPCCWDCNRAKGDMTREQFKAHIKRMHDHMFKVSEPDKSEETSDQIHCPKPLQAQ